MPIGKGENLLLHGQRLREQGNTFEALDYLNRALEAFVKERDYSPFAHTLLDRAICWQHLYWFNGNDFAFAVLCKKEAEAMMEIVRTKDLANELCQAYFINAKASSMFKDYARAIELYKKAIAGMPEGRQAQKGDWQTNLGKAIYLNGQKEQGLQQILEGLGQIKQYSSGIDKYTSNVWLSGAYLRLAEVLKNDNPKESKKYLSEAEQVINSDPQQIIRKKQLKIFTKEQTTDF